MARLANLGLDVYDKDGDVAIRAPDGNEFSVLTPR